MTFNPSNAIAAEQVLESGPSLFRETRTHAPGPEGALPITAEMLLTQPSGNLFGLSQNAGMGWEPARLLDPEFLILSTHGGMRAQDGTPIALGFHTGHWEVGLLVAEAARELRDRHCVPFAGACTDPCDGRTQGTAGMLDSLPYRNDAAIVLRRLMRSLPHAQRRDWRGDLRQRPAGDDDGAGVVRPRCRASSFPAESRCSPKTARMRARCSPSARAMRRSRSRWSMPRSWAAAPARRRAAAASSWARRRRRRWSPRRWGCRCPMRRSRPRASRSGWIRPRARRARSLRMAQLGIGTRDVLTDAAIRNAMVLHAAFGGSTNLLLHVPAIAHAAGLRRPYGGGLGCDQSRGAQAGRCAAEWAEQLRDGAGISRRRRARSHAASAACRAAGLPRADCYRATRWMRT